MRCVQRRARFEHFEGGSRRVMASAQQTAPLVSIRSVFDAATEDDFIEAKRLLALSEQQHLPT